MNGIELDALLRDGLAPPAGPPDRAFVARVEKAVAEAEHARLWRARVAPQMVTEGIALAAAMGGLAFIARAPALRAAFARAPELAWPALLALLLFWMLIRGRGDILGRMGGSALISTRRPWRLSSD